MVKNKNLSISEALLLRQVGSSVEMCHHGISVMERHCTRLAVERSQSLLMLPRDLQVLSWRSGSGPLELRQPGTEYSCKDRKSYIPAVQCLYRSPTRRRYSRIFAILIPPTCFPASIGGRPGTPLVPQSRPYQHLIEKQLFSGCTCRNPSLVPWWPGIFCSKTWVASNWEIAA